MDEFKFYHIGNKNFKYKAKFTEFEEKEIYIVMWAEGLDIDSVIYPKEEVEYLINKKIWCVID